MISVSAMLMALLPQISVCKYRTDIKVYRYITSNCLVLIWLRQIGVCSVYDGQKGETIGPLWISGMIAVCPCECSVLLLYTNKRSRSV